MKTFQSDPSYQALRGALGEGTTQVVALVGSGLSAPADVPTWSPLRRTLVEKLRAKAATFPPGEARRLAEKADSIERERDFWVAFSRLKDELKKTTFDAEIRAALRAAEAADPPASYEQVWRIPRLEGVLTLNLDRFVLRSFSAIHPGADLKHFIGKDAARLQRILHSGTRFAFSLHGVIDDADSWVLTKEDLNRLLKDPAYKSLLHTVLATYTVVFLGVGADDIAVGGPLDDLIRHGVQGRTHYWITSRRDTQTDTWAEGHGIRVIRYAVSGDDHAMLDAILADLTGYVPADIDNPRPVTLRIDGPVDERLPPPAELVKYEIAHIRNVLNQRATELLPGDEFDEQSDAAYAAFDAFLDEYDEAIHRAWYTSDKVGRNALFGYTLLEEVATGAFGKVYRATDGNGDIVAIKVLLEEIRRDPKLVKSFRRGVRAMRILQQHGVDGMVAYREATEIPAFVSMEWIEGPNLVDAKDARQLEDWDVVLRIAQDIVAIIRRAHDLPERVLHRDIRPSNIMLRQFYTDADGWDVVVLDFDLAWHRGASGKSVLHTTAYGYLAPEQIHNRRHEPTRSAAVDVFGLGMTFLFLCGGREPAADEHNHRDYARFVADAVRALADSEWRSLPTRMGRLITAMTRDAQADRVDLGQVSRELELLRRANTNPSDVESVELLCEEVAASTDVLRDYEWAADMRAATIQKPTGLRVTLSADEERDLLALVVSWDATGVESRSGLARNAYDAARSSEATLKAAGWHVENRTKGKAIAINATLSAESVRGNVRGTAAKVDMAVAPLRRTE